jgi:hypothetical protein
MINVKIEHKNKIIELTHPELLNELDEEQLKSVILLVILRDTPMDHRQEDRIRLTQILLSQELNPYFKNRWYQVTNDLINEGLYLDLLKLQDFIYKEQTFNNWIIKKLKVKKNILYGPRDRFSYMKFGEFIVADMLFMQYYQTKSEETLNRFIAALYRNRKKKVSGDEDPREEFNTNTISARAAEIKDIGIVLQQSIVFNYSGMRAWLCDKYKYVFDPPKKEEEVIINNKPGGWMSIRRHLAGNVLNLEKVDQVLVHDVLSDLNEKMSEQ